MKDIKTTRAGWLKGLTRPSYLGFTPRRLKWGSPNMTISGGSNPVGSSDMTTSNSNLTNKSRFDQCLLVVWGTNLLVKWTNLDWSNKPQISLSVLTWPGKY